MHQGSAQDHPPLGGAVLSTPYSCSGVSYVTMSEFIQVVGGSQLNNPRFTSFTIGFAVFSLSWVDES